MPSFDPAKDISDLSGKVILVTGGTSGIGKATVLALTKHNPARIYFTGRNTQAAAAVISETGLSSSSTKLTFIPLDLASSRTRIRTALATGFTADRLDILIANAGIMATPPGLTEEGWEVQWGTNYLGHAIVLQLLRPIMLRTAALADADVRLVGLSSSGHRITPPGGILFDDGALEQAEAISWEFARYGQSKLGNILLCKSMARHYPEITSVAVHPGLVQTGLLDATKPSALKCLISMVPFLYRSADEGAYNTLWAATTDVACLENGQYYEPVGKIKGASALVGDEALAERLWQWTADELKDLKSL